jgi:hypothetical protein
VKSVYATPVVGYNASASHTFREMFETVDAVTTVVAHPVLTVKTKVFGETSYEVEYTNPFTVTDETVIW